jgi:hypothetical protein
MKCNFGVVVSLVICSFLIVACKNNETVVNQKLADSVPVELPADTLAVVNEFPADTGARTQLLLPKSYHSNELDGVENGSTWLGLFLGKQGYYTAQTKIFKNKVHDDVVDADSENTGWMVTVENTDSCLMLTKLGLLLPITNIEKILSEQEPMPPYDKLTFLYKEGTYQLYATGMINTENNMVTNYRLYADVTIDGRTQTSLLMTTSGFNETIATVLFAGDLNGDGLVDLIINTSTHYNTFKPTLYLSNSHRQPWILPVGWHISVGC